jgi:hypothetical protein
MKTANVILLTTLLVLMVLSSTRAQDAARAPTLTIDQARQMIGHTSATGTLGTIDIHGLNYSRELDLGHGVRVIVLSKNLSGGIAAFSPNGLLENSITTNEITWAQLFDLNDDGVSELVTEEIEGRGTGILVKNFSLYVIGPGGIKQAWKRVSYRREAAWKPEGATEKPTETQYFLRFDQAGAGYPSRMTYLEPLNHSGQFRKTVYIMSGETIREIPERRNHSE